jgi:hypothetical protein
LKDGETRLHDKRLSRLIDILPSQFDSLHRSYVVSMESVVALETVSNSDYQVVIKDGSKIPISHSKKSTGVETPLNDQARVYIFYRLCQSLSFFRCNQFRQIVDPCR